MKKIFLLLSLGVVFGLRGCYNKDGECLHPPHFLPTTLNFGVNGGSSVINASGLWFIRSIVIDDTCYFNYYLPRLCGQTGEGDCLLVVHCDSVYDDFVHQYPIERMLKIEGTWFCMTIEGEATDTQLLLFSVKPNSTGKSRKLQLSINGRNCPAPILTITQSAE